MAPHDQHSVVMGLDGVETSTPLAAPLLLSVTAIQSFHATPDKFPVSEFQSHGTAVLNFAATGVEFGCAVPTKKKFRSHRISWHSDSETRSPGASGFLRNRESCRAGK